MNLKTNIIIFFVAFLSIFCWEHIEKKHSFVGTKPSIILNYIGDYLIDLWELLGKWFAKISSFLTFIDFEELKETFYDIMLPCIRIMTSYFYMVKGYVTTLNLYENQVEIILGSSIIFTLFIITYWYFNLSRYPPFSTLIRLIKGNLFWVQLSAALLLLALAILAEYMYHHLQVGYVMNNIQI